MERMIMKPTFDCGCVAIVVLAARFLKTNARKFARPALLVLAASFLMSTPLLAQTGLKDWSVGDVFVGTGNGSYEVWHSANPAAKNSTYSILQTLNDGTSNGGSTNGGATAGCAFDLAYRFFGTNLSNTLVDRYAIDNGDNNNHSIVQQLASHSGGSQSQSAAFDGGKNLFIGYAAGVTGGYGTIEQWAKDTNPSSSTYGNYVFVTSFPVPVDNAGPGWIDLAADG